MVQGRLVMLGLVLTGLVPSIPVFAKSPACEANLKLQDYEPNTLGIRQDENDTKNIDFKISQMFPVAHDGCAGSESQKNWYWRPYFAFTGQFGFYALGGRDSSPVIPKRFNPQAFMRHWFEDNESYVDVGYAHESNGQSITTQAAYDQKVVDIQAAGERVEFASDFLSRGWDYINLSLKQKVMNGSLLGKNSLYLNLKYFLPQGLLQGPPEEFYSWETTTGKYRREVDGVSMLFKTSNISSGQTVGYKFVLGYTTGYENAFRYHSMRAEVGIKVRDLPAFTFWAARGYNTDLSDYYKDLSSYGVELEFRNFVSDY